MIIIRDLKPEDKDKGLLEVYREVWNITEITDKTMIDYLSNDNHMVVAEDDGVIIGTITLHIQKKIIRNGGISGMIEDFAVKESYRSQNIGSKMVKYTIEKAIQLGCYKVILSCYPQRISFYERNGFKVESSTMRHYLN